MTHHSVMFVHIIDDGAPQMRCSVTACCDLSVGCYMKTARMCQLHNGYIIPEKINGIKTTSHLLEKMEQQDQQVETQPASKLQSLLKLITSPVEDINAESSKEDQVAALLLST